MWKWDKGIPNDNGYLLFGHVNLGGDTVLSIKMTIVSDLVYECDNGEQQCDDELKRVKDWDDNTEWHVEDYALVNTTKNWWQDHQMTEIASEFVIQVGQNSLEKGSVQCNTIDVDWKKENPQRVYR